MKAKIAFFVALFFLISGALIADGINLRADLDDGVEEESSFIDDLDIVLRSNPSGGFRSRQVKNKLSVRLLRGLRARPGHFLSAGGTTKPSGFSQQELYRLQEVYRL